MDILETDERASLIYSSKCQGGLDSAAASLLLFILNSLVFPMSSLQQVHGPRPKWLNRKRSPCTILQSSP
ncbi:hypothetical protein N7536_009076 [Penicillium majusculum]|nr:hypothetical protein N7536_009076 [Penicillium majusculum]